MDIFDLLQGNSKKEDKAHQGKVCERDPVVLRNDSTNLPWAEYVQSQSQRASLHLGSLHHALTNVPSIRGRNECENLESSGREENEMHGEIFAPAALRQYS